MFSCCEFGCSVSFIVFEFTCNTVAGFDVSTLLGVNGEESFCSTATLSSFELKAYNNRLNELFKIRSKISYRVNQIRNTKNTSNANTFSNVPFAHCLLYLNSRPDKSEYPRSTLEHIISKLGESFDLVFSLLQKTLPFL